MQLSVCQTLAMQGSEVVPEVRKKSSRKVVLLTQENSPGSIDSNAPALKLLQQACAKRANVGGGAQLFQVYAAQPCSVQMAT